MDRGVIIRSGSAQSACLVSRASAPVVQSVRTANLAARLATRARLVLDITRANVER